MSSFQLTPPFQPIQEYKPSFNIGALFDIPTGKYVKGRFGEWILNGGLGAITAVVGIGNNFKSTILHYMLLMVLARFTESTASTYDTEINISKSRLAELAAWIEGLEDEQVLDVGRWIITDKTEYYANEWYEIFKSYLKGKQDNAKQFERTSPFFDHKKGENIKMLVPTPAEVDSFTEFETEDVAGMQAANELGDSGANTIFMRQGQSKTRFLQDVPKLVNKSNSPLLMTAHIGKVIGMDPRAAPVKKLQYLKNGDVIKGGTDKFLFLTTNCWQAANAVPLINETSKGAEYPRSSDEVYKGDTDLNLVTLTNLRNKNGMSGFLMQIIVSQKEGVLPSLTEFHYLKTNDRFGFQGNVQNYQLVLCPEIALSRTTIRSKIAKHPELRRALNILAELSQMTYMQRTEHEEYLCTPQQLYDDLKKQGYDWDYLLKHTRGWWTFDNEKPVIRKKDNAPMYFLSTKDLLMMRQEKYFPFWMDPQTKQAK